MVVHYAMSNLRYEITKINLNVIRINNVFIVYCKKFLSHISLGIEKYRGRRGYSSHYSIRLNMRTKKKEKRGETLILATESKPYPKEHAFIIYLRNGGQ